MNTKLNEQVGRKVFNIYFATSQFRRTGGLRIAYRMQYKKDNTPVWHPGGGEFGWGWCSVRSEFPDYTEKIHYTWKIVTEMKERFDLQLTLVTDKKHSVAMFKDKNCKIIGYGEAKKDGEAICFAALDVMKKRKKK